MDGGSWHCTGGSDQNLPQEKEMQKGKMVVWGGLTNSWEKRSERQRRKGKIYPSECRVPGNRKPSSVINAKKSVQFSSVAQLCPTRCNPMDCSTPGFPVHHQLPELAQTHVHKVGDAIKPSHPLSASSPPTFNLSQHQGLFKWVSSSHQVAKVLEFQLQHQSFQWIFRTDFL